MNHSNLIICAFSPTLILINLEFFVVILKIENFLSNYYIIS